VIVYRMYGRRSWYRSTFFAMSLPVVFQQLPFTTSQDDRLYIIFPISSLLFSSYNFPMSSALLTWMFTPAFTLNVCNHFLEDFMYAVPGCTAHVRHAISVATSVSAVIAYRDSSSRFPCSRGGPPTRFPNNSQAVAPVASES
jgi:hypothetical protein